MTEELLKQRKEMLVQLVHDKTYVPMKLKELAMLLSVPKEQRDELKEVLDILIAEGKIGISKKGKYGKAEEFALAGIFSGHAKGFGFVTIEGREQDVFIPADKTKGAMDGDKVQIVIEGEARGKRAEGAVLRILEHANKTVIGFYQKNKNFGFVLPDNQKLGQDIFIPQGKDMGAVTGHKVIVRITDFGDDRKKPEGVITEILGHVNDPGVDILSIIKAYGLPEGFPDDVMVQVAGIPDEVEEEEKKNRLDLRHLQTVTIDGEDAKDLDDAISISKKNDDHYTLGVHIADVSHYVTENSPLDKEALKRGTSVYLVDRVIPMLPHKLSNGICSLNAGTDRLALSCLMEIDGKGNVIGHRIAETLIQVDRRMTYTAVNYERNAATKIIEDFMLMANETIAEDYFWQELPFLYRTHDYPDPEKMKRLGTFINNFGYTIRTQNGEVHPKELQKLLDKIEGTPEEALISRLTLRSMKQAKYTTVCTGHFGLAANYYTHFTSPIRRYPDLQIHRIIKENLRRGLSDRRFAHYDSILPEVAVQCSSMERRADEAERETDKLKKCEYMSKRIGKEYDGVISGVTNWGLYVELPNTVEGLIRVNDLTGDYFVFDEEHMELVGEMTRKSYKLGQKIRVQVADTDKLTRTIDFIPAKWQEEDE